MIAIKPYEFILVSLGGTLTLRVLLVRGAAQRARLERRLGPGGRNKHGHDHQRGRRAHGNQHFGDVMDFLQLDVAQQHAVRDAIVAEWRRRQGDRYLPRPGAWHRCDPDACRMVQLACDVRLEPRNRVRFVAPGDGHVRVRNVFVCWKTGKVHVCTDACTRNAHGACWLTGHRCQSAALPPAHGDTSASRRAVAVVHRRGAIAGSDVVRRATRCILEYLCFSETRRSYALRLLEAARSKTRRWVMRRVREGHATQYADILEFYASTAFAARSCTRPLRMQPAVRHRLLRAVSTCVHRLHVALGPDVVDALASVRVFSLAAVYLMRTGLRSSTTGLMAVPRVPLLGVILPNAHLLSSNTFPDIHETQNRSRQLTNAVRYLGAAILKVGTTVGDRWWQDGAGLDDGMSEFVNQ